MTPNPSSAPLEERVTDAIATRQLRIRQLSYCAWTLGGLSLLASIVIVAIYFTSYLPKQRQLMQELGQSMNASPAAAGEIKDSPTPAENPSERAANWRRDFPGIQTVMTHVLGIGTMLLALAVGLLSLGVLVIFAVVFLTRRATLSQIQTSLAEISARLQTLGNAQG